MCPSTFWKMSFATLEYFAAQNISLIMPSTALKVGRNVQRKMHGDLMHPGKVIAPTSSQRDISIFMNFKLH